MLFTKMSVFSKNQMKPINTLCGENTEVLNVLVHVTYK
jgi:hypothetical protein